MNCQTCQNELLHGAKLSEAALEHLDHCAQCRDFIATLDLVAPPAPSKEVDARVRAACHGVLAAQRLLPRRNRFKRIWLGVAAAAVILLGVVLLHDPQRKAPAAPRALAVANPAIETAEYADALTWDVGVSLSARELDQAEVDMELLIAGL